MSVMICGRNTYSVYIFLLVVKFSTTTFFLRYSTHLYVLLYSARQIHSLKIHSCLDQSVCNKSGISIINRTKNVCVAFETKLLPIKLNRFWMKNARIMNFEMPRVSFKILVDASNKLNYSAQRLKTKMTTASISEKKITKIDFN